MSFLDPTPWYMEIFKLLLHDLQQILWIYQHIKDSVQNLKWKIGNSSRWPDTFTVFWKVKLRLSFIDFEILRWFKLKINENSNKFTIILYLSASISYFGRLAFIRSSQWGECANVARQHLCYGWSEISVLFFYGAPSSTRIPVESRDATYGEPRIMLSKSQSYKQ